MMTSKRDKWIVLLQGIMYYQDFKVKVETRQQDTENEDIKISCCQLM